MSEDTNDKYSIIETNWQRLGLAALGGVIGSIIGNTIVNGRF